MKNFKYLLLFALLVSCAPDEPALLATQDPWSADCPDGLAGVFVNDSLSCETFLTCRNDSDCAYLNIDNLPPRYGTCVSGVCRTLCGSGVIRECR